MVFILLAFHGKPSTSPDPPTDDDTNPKPCRVSLARRKEAHERPHLSPPFSAMRRIDEPRRKWQDIPLLATRMRQVRLASRTLPEKDQVAEASPQAEREQVRISLPTREYSAKNSPCGGCWHMPSRILRNQTNVSRETSGPQTRKSRRIELRRGGLRDLGCGARTYNSSSTADATTSGMLVVGSKRRTTLPSRSIRNFVKFHLMLGLLA